MNIVRKAIFLVGFVVALSMLEVNIGPLLAAIGAAGFILGFALQGTLSNFAAGIMILIYRPYDVGDLVDVAGTFGKVDAMTIVSTTLRKPDNQNVVVPNNMIWVIFLLYKLHMKLGVKLFSCRRPHSSDRCRIVTDCALSGLAHHKRKPKRKLGEKNNRGQDGQHQQHEGQSALKNLHQRGIFDHALDHE